jgi:hypothetical protein
MKINTSSMFPVSKAQEDKAAAAYSRGCRFAYVVARCGGGFSKTEAGAEKSAKRMARNACSSNPPLWSVGELSE